MKKQPDAVFIIDLRKEQLAVREARRLGLPVLALVDTNCDPDDANYPVPGNDDAIRSCELITRAIVDAIEEGTTKASPAEFQQQAAAETPEPAAEEQPAEEAPEYEQLGQKEEAVEPPPETPAEPVEAQP
jgi:small subunit ribosomal protein S2